MMFKKKECLFLSALTLALIAGPALSQQDVDVGGDAIIAQPVNVNESMAPTTVPQATSLPSSTLSENLRVNTPNTSVSASGAGGLEVKGAGTGIGGDNPGNANTGGVQVQNITVQANPTQDVTTDSLNRASLMRAERKRQEQGNEDRLLEKIEKGRLEDELERTKSIDGFKGSLSSAAAAAAASSGPQVVSGSSDLESVPVSAAAASASAEGDNASAQAIAISSDSDVIVTSVSAKDDEDRSSFRLAPFAGYKWLPTSDAGFDIDSMGVFGVNFDGVLNKYLALEGSFAFSREKMESPFDMYGPNGGYNGGCGGGGGCMNGGGYYAQSGYTPAVRARNNFELTGGIKAGMQMGRFRPYSSVAFGARLTKYDIDDSYTTNAANGIGWLRSTTHMLTNLGGGLDVGLSKSIAVGLRYDYQLVINKKRDDMQFYYGDSDDSYRLTGNMQIGF